MLGGIEELLLGVGGRPGPVGGGHADVFDGFGHLGGGFFGLGVEGRPEPLPPRALGWWRVAGRRSYRCWCWRSGRLPGVSLLEGGVAPELLLLADWEEWGSAPAVLFPVGLRSRSCWLAWESWSAACCAAAGSPEAAADWALRAAWTAWAVEEPVEEAEPDWPVPPELCDPDWGRWGRLGLTLSRIAGRGIGRVCWLAFWPPCRRDPVGRLLLAGLLAALLAALLAILLTALLSRFVVRMIVRFAGCFVDCLLTTLLTALLTGLFGPPLLILLLAILLSALLAGLGGLALRLLKGFLGASSREREARGLFFWRLARCCRCGWFPARRLARWDWAAFFAGTSRHSLFACCDSSGAAPWVFCWSSRAERAACSIWSARRCCSCADCSELDLAFSAVCSDWLACDVWLAMSRCSWARRRASSAALP